MANEAAVLSAANKTLLALLCELAVPTYCVPRAPAHARLARTATLALRWVLLAALKRELGNAADECIKTLKAEMLAATV